MRNMFSLLMSFAFFTGSLISATSVTQYGITWHFDGDYQTGQFVNGDYWVIGPVTITSKEPVATTNPVLHGSQINPVALEYQGYDSRVSGVYDPALSVSFPVTLQPGESMYSMESRPEGDPSRQDLFGPGGNSRAVDLRVVPLVNRQRRDLEHRSNIDRDGPANCVRQLHIGQTCRVLR